ncbi:MULTISPECIES: DUF4194 domain-containing protein [unclassified Undibacterium]|uniref:DUF4194 domain-containing protein n=2 Tax=Undibacterium TaxID=401469 RepID=UPI002AC930F1|nr:MULTISPECIES: DUF4194 domain-containing protein [unclassified Undibacterium]MEB0140724.1 DUF4194 domain-containing protein [Undibacterium sp. CCC2.1]MEB0173741.1 DUF4194 domain-containing protein [Undibacterium sp. CCC1.1]MEB0216909.1 DUF4194 domain-containing protein [Undibacterium sp. 5I2]WPX41975.1 DUF4194 domain-containing protein [Undibacterium sp. CCC3.4]
MDASYETAAAVAIPNLSALLINLLKGVLYREGDERMWASLLQLQTRVRDYVTVLNLELVLDEAEGYAFLKSRPEPSDDDPAPRLPRLVARRPLSFPVSLLLALLRKKLAEFDAGGGDTRLVQSRAEIVELLRIFLPEGPNEARLIDQIEAIINKVVDLGFLHKLKAVAGSEPSYEVRRLLKAFVDAQWLAEFDARLAQYRTQLAGTGSKTDE